MFYRWLRRWGGLILLAGAAVAVAWILLLPKLPEPPPISPQPPETAPAVSATPVEPPDSPTTDQKPEPTPAPRNVTAPPPADDSGPIVDLRRTQERPTAPAGTEPTDPRKREPPQEFDRSPESRQRGIERFGGTPQTETAVEAGLAWLAAHQSPGGIWDRFNFADQDPRGDRCTGEAIDRTTTSLDAGLTGLCVLAFLGAGYTDQDGPYREVVHNGVGALLEMQKEHGGFGPDPEDGMAGYNDSLATFALAEYYAMTRRPDVVEPLKRAVGRIVRNQQALGGWDYQPWPTIGRNDTSISAWMVQALHACAAAGIEVPRETLVKAALHFSRAAQPDGRVWYSDQGTGFELDGARQPRYRYGPAMTAAGLTCEQLLGWRLDDVIPRKQAALVLARPPSPEKFHGRDTSQLHSEYYWYYATVAMFQRGGGEWERWNAKLRDAVLPLQNREKTAAGRKRSAHGSWDPYAKHWGKWGKMGSRVYTTAICVLTLEIYYRHTPAYLTEDLLLTVDAWREYLAQVSPRRRLEAVSCLAALRYEIAEEVLVELLADADQSVALAAAEALAWNDSPMGLTLLEEVVTRLPPWGRRSTEQALGRVRELIARPPAEGRVRVYDGRRRLATLDLPQSYVGMRISIRRDDRELARMRIVQRYSGRPLVVAELIGEPGPTPPQTGDLAVSTD